MAADVEAAAPGEMKPPSPKKSSKPLNKKKARAQAKKNRKVMGSKKFAQQMLSGRTDLPLGKKNDGLAST